MNYRHAYHAGNFADVVKHAVLALVIERLKAKEAAFRVVDTHAGVGAYDLTEGEAQRTGEWRTGIGRLVGPDAAPLPADVEAVLAPYLDVIRAFNPVGGLARYPGSPRIARALLRPQDRLIVNELHPHDAVQLRRLLGRDPQSQVMTLDGWTMLKAVLPPKERRGVILVDPPFEEAGELDRLVMALVEGVKRFQTGVFLLWYPIKDPAPIAQMKRKMAALGLAKLTALEFLVRPADDPRRLNGAGLVMLNAPYLTDQALAMVMPCLTERLALQGAGRWRLETIEA